MSDAIQTRPIFVSNYARQKFGQFESSYLKLRSEEQRVLTKEQLLRLPYPDRSDPDFEHWAIRRKNIDRFLRYLKTKKEQLNILDVGCGNGFFSHLMCLQGHRVTGLDVNFTELQQAAEAFPAANLNWCCLDLLDEPVPGAPYNLITFCASFHYFRDSRALLERCQSLLAAGGEIHIIDSPFYSDANRSEARARSLDYFSQHGVPDLIQHYYHNTYADLSAFRYRFGYKPGGWLNRLLRRHDSPFPWLILDK